MLNYVWHIIHAGGSPSAADQTTDTASALGCGHGECEEANEGGGSARLDEAVDRLMKEEATGFGP
jgi:hypothetical protein